MKVGFFQYNIIWRDREANLSYIRSKIKDSAFDLLVLPELFTSGYAFESREELMPFAENLEDSYTVRFLTELMKECGGYITGSIPELCNEKLYNTSVIVGAEGLVASYRKIHLPDYEKRAFESGDKAVSCTCNEMKVGLTICFDAWFAPLSSSLKLQGVNVICLSACFGGGVTPTIIPIRALENQCFYISCNRIGTEMFSGEPDSYRGESQIVNPDGKILIKAGNEELLSIIDIDLSEVNNPAFGSLVKKDFLSEHKKYNIMIK
ncbi:MAG: carbon-nitrogen hydrolase family protein [Tannerella sp.]|jgi:predicted amidohydrolase|nr:carbon-nitrogen hydrolase family protein [Tannerella sp.]